MNITNLPALYNQSVKGGLMIWQVSVIEKDNTGIIKIERGFVGGKIQKQEQVIEQGKNIGKKNETTPYQQAIAEATSKWNLKKTKNGYTESQQTEKEDKKQNKQQDSQININPMLAKDFNKDSNKLLWKNGVVWQPKLDGVRALIGFDDGKVFLKSRGNKFYQNLNHIKDCFLKLYQSNKIPTTLLFDCELYTKELKFEEITGICRKQKELDQKTKIKELKIEAHIFDLFDTNSQQLQFQERYKIIQKLLKKIPQPVVIVHTETVNSQDDLYELHKLATEQGYEGIMLRNITGKYKQGPTRSNDLIKMKTMIDDEFEIVNFKEGQGLEKGTVIWTCITNSGDEFSVRPTGTREQRKEWFTNGNKYIGKQLTVQFQEWSKDNIPRFPVGIAIRDYE